MPTRVALAPLALTLALATAAAAQEGETPAPPPRVDCASPDHRAFDFWVGAWDVHDPEGEKVGENTITVIEDGCALHERWRSVAGPTGRSFSYFDASTGTWHQTWVASTGRPLRLEGAVEDGAMVMTMESPAIRHRVAWSANDDGTVRQHWVISTDGGETWRTAFDGEYRPRD